jgi:hypothetical protein
VSIWFSISAFTNLFVVYKYLELIIVDCSIV